MRTQTTTPPTPLQAPGTLRAVQVKHARSRRAHDSLEKARSSSRGCGVSRCANQGLHAISNATPNNPCATSLLHGMINPTLRSTASAIARGYPRFPRSCIPTFGLLVWSGRLHIGQQEQVPYGEEQVAQVPPDRTNGAPAMSHARKEPTPPCIIRRHEPKARTKESSRFAAMLDVNWELS